MLDVLLVRFNAILGANGMIKTYNEAEVFAISKSLRLIMFMYEFQTVEIIF